jgi:anti-sigma B factor antagonist
VTADTTADTSTNPHAARIVIEDDMTIYHATALKATLLGSIQRHQLIELDLSRVAEIDTAGLQLLLLARREAQRCDTTLRMLAHSPAVHELIDFFDIAGLLGDPLIIPAQNDAA